MSTVRIVLTFCLLIYWVHCCQFTSNDNLPPHNYTEPCSNICSVSFKGVCSCFIIRRLPVYPEIYLECSNTNASFLTNDIDRLSYCNFSLIQLNVTNSNLTRLYNLPSGLYNIQELILDNTGIDLETIRESQELLKSLKVLRISNENFTEIPETLFNGMEELKELSLNNLGMAYISVDSFISLQDSLTLLELRANKIRTIPNAVQMLSHLECLDLSENDIKTVSDGNTVIYSTGLKRLKRLRISPMNCSCEFGKSKFATWLRTYAIRGVVCRMSNRMAEKDVFTTPIEEFCDTASLPNTNRMSETDIFYTTIEEFCQNSAPISAEPLATLIVISLLIQTGRLHYCFQLILITFS